MKKINFLGQVIPMAQGIKGAIIDLENNLNHDGSGVIGDISFIINGNDRATKEALLNFLGWAFMLKPQLKDPLFHAANKYKFPSQKEASATRIFIRDI
jgi:hypothetical protein